MFKKVFFICFALVLVFCVFSCSAYAISTYQEKEPNNWFDTANNLGTFGADEQVYYIYGKIHCYSDPYPPNDKDDYFSVYVTDNISSIKLTGVDFYEQYYDVVVDMAVYDINKRKIATAQKVSDGKAINLTLGPGTYYIKVYPSSWPVYRDGPNYTVTIKTSAPDIKAPSAPTNLTCTSMTSTSVKLSWNASTDNLKVTGYDIYSGSSKIASTGATSYTITGHTAKTTYSFTVKARDASGNLSLPSNTLSITTPSVTGPVALYRYNNGVDHFYTTNFSELGSGKLGYKLEGIQCYVYSTQQPSTVPLYRYCNGVDHFYTTNFSELGSGKLGYKLEGIQCYVYSTQQPNTIPLYRYSNGVDHFYTTNFSELGSGKMGYKLEGIQCYVLK